MTHQKLRSARISKFMFLHPVLHRSSHFNSDSQVSLISNASDGGVRHLALVFFDILLLDDQSFLSTTYATRRAVLESIISPDSGRIMLSERVPISLSTTTSFVEDKDPAAQLRTLFAKLIADYQEGVVIKADQGRYNDKTAPWVKVRYTFEDNCILYIDSGVAQERLYSGIW